MREKSGKRKFNEKGITLIALIITIIIMLILVAVTIDIAVDGKLFDKAQQAVDETNEKVGLTQNRVDELMEELNENEIEENYITFYILTNSGSYEYTVVEGTTWENFLVDNKLPDELDNLRFYVYEGAFMGIEGVIGAYGIEAAGPVYETTGSWGEGPWVHPSDPLKEGVTYNCER